MAVPVDNRSYMKRATDKGNLKNIGAAPAKLKGTNKDNPTIEKLGGYQTNLGRSRTDFGQSDDTGPAKKPSRIGTKPKALSKKKTPSSDPTGAPKQTLLQKQKQTADRIRAGGKSKPAVISKPKPAKVAAPDPTSAPKQTLLQKQKQLANRIRAGGKSKPKAAPAKELDIAPAPASIAKPKAKGAPEKSITKALQTNLGRSRTAFGQSDDTGPSKTGPSKRAKKPAPTPPAKKAEPPAKKAEPPKPKTPSKPRPATPKLAPRPKPKPAVRKRADTGQRPDSRGSGKDKDLFDTPAGVTSGDDEFYKFYGKPGTTIGDFSRKFGIKYATQKGFERDFPEHDGEQMGGRPGKSKMKTQGLNRSKRSGFSGRGTGAALRGF